MADLAMSGFTVDDLDGLREACNVTVHVELDLWGSAVVTPVEARKPAEGGQPERSTLTVPTV